jgi:trk system potassium uptake protein TrkA
VPKVIARVLDPRRASWYAEQGLQTVCPTAIAIDQLERAALGEAEAAVGRPGEEGA